MGDIGYKVLVDTGTHWVAVSVVKAGVCVSWEPKEGEDGADCLLTPRQSHEFYMALKRVMEK